MLAGYGLGLVIAFVASLLMGVGQPALLYLVPLSLIPIMVTALIRREFKAIWSGDTDKVSLPLVPLSCLASVCPSLLLHALEI